MTAYYNEIDKFAAQWLRNLISAGEIAPGDVDERDIWDVQPDDLRGYTQCHFFAGIGIWSDVLRRAGWPDDRPAWTGSCPCQPFSAAGKGRGFADERHLWPAWHHLIQACRPAHIFGEQVANGAGGTWLDLVFTDLACSGYAIGAADLCSAGVGAPNIRQRYGFVAHAHDAERRAEVTGRNYRDWPSSRWSQVNGDPSERGAHDAVRGFWRGAEWLVCGDGKRRPVEAGTFPLAARNPSTLGSLRAYGNALNAETWAAFVGAYIDEQAYASDDTL